MSPGWVKSHIRMSHVTHRIYDDFKGTQDTWQSHVTYRGVMSNIAMSYEWVMSHTYMSHITHGICDDSRGTNDKWKNHVTYREVISHVWTSHGSVMSHIWTIFVTHMNNLCHTHEPCVSHVTSAAMSKVHTTYENVMPHTWMSHGSIMSHIWTIYVPHMNHLCHMYRLRQRQRCIRLMKTCVVVCCSHIRMLRYTRHELQCVAVMYSVLQCVAVIYVCWDTHDMSCSVLQSCKVCCSVLQSYTYVEIHTTWGAVCCSHV